VRISIDALIVPLYDPIRLGEDIAVWDTVAQGRFSFVAGKIVINPLVGGPPIDEGWASLQLLTDEVLPRL
jgi:hypothetical protein